MTQNSLVSETPYDDYALAMRHGNPLLAAQVARANGLGSDFICEPVLTTVRKFAVNGLRQAAEEIAKEFETELNEHFSPEEIALALDGRDPADVDIHDRPTDPCIAAPAATEDPDAVETVRPEANAEEPEGPVHHVLPHPHLPFGQEETGGLRFSAVGTDLLADFIDDEADTLVDVTSPFAETSSGHGTEGSPSSGSDITE